MGTRVDSGPSTSAACLAGKDGIDEEEGEEGRGGSSSCCVQVASSDKRAGSPGCRGGWRREDAACG